MVLVEMMLGRILWNVMSGGLQNLADALWKCLCLHIFTRRWHMQPCLCPNFDNQYNLLVFCVPFVTYYNLPKLCVVS
jgi:hypothetical protein